MMFDEQRLGNDGTEASRPCKPNDGNNQMKEKDEDIVHPSMVSKPKKTKKTPNFCPNSLIRHGQVKMRYEVYSHATAAYIAPFPERVDAHLETTNLAVWNALEGATNQQELVYEVSWIEELGMWRRFLTARRKVQN